MKRRRLKGGLALATVFALCASLGAGSAFAAGTTDLTGTDGASWEIPTQEMTNTVWKDADGNLVAAGTEGATQYKVLTTWAEAWSTSGADYLGISNSAFYGNGGNGNARVETYEAAANNTTVGVWATAANESPNAYNWNTFYNLYANTSDGMMAGAVTSSWASVSTTTNGGADWSSEAGVWCGFKYRPDVVVTNNNLSASAAATYISYIQQGKYSATATMAEGSSTYEPDTGDDGTYNSAYETYHIEGDEYYNPQIISYNNNSPYSFVASAYELAAAAEAVIAATADYEGLSDGQTLDWRTVNLLPRSNRYSETPTECALNIERLAKGSVYYTLSQIALGTVERKTVAYVAYPWDYSGNSFSTTSTQVVVAVYDYTENIGTGPMDGRASWTPLVVDQLSTNSVAQAKTGGGAVSSSDESTTTYTLYFATADDLANVDVVYCSPNVGKTATELQQWIETNASSDSAASQAASISYLTDWPCITNGSNYTMEKLIYGAFGMDFIYPELFPSMQLSSFWCDEIYHLTDDSLAVAMSWIYAPATLASGASLSNIPAQYSLDEVLGKFATGLAYYQAAYESDATITRVLSNTALDGTTELDGVAYAFNGFKPTDTWLADPGEATETVIFTDLSSDEWYYSTVLRAASLGYMNGNDDSTDFRPDDNISRAETAQVLYNMEASVLSATGSSVSFPDVPEDEWFYSAVSWASSAGIVTGYLDTGLYDPFGDVTREQVALMLYRTAQALGLDTSARDSLSDYSDASLISDYAYEAVQWAVAVGIMGQDVTDLRPNDSISRAEIATMAVRFDALS